MKNEKEKDCGSIRELASILTDMDVPSMRMNDMRWLSRNLGVRNSKHPDFKRAMELITNNL